MIFDIKVSRFECKEASTVETGGACPVEECCGLREKVENRNWRSKNRWWDEQGSIMCWKLRPPRIQMVNLQLCETARSSFCLRARDFHRLKEATETEKRLCKTYGREISITLSVSRRLPFSGEDHSPSIQLYLFSHNWHLHHRYHTQVSLFSFVPLFSASCWMCFIRFRRPLLLIPRQSAISRLL